ncbi:MAG TPA: hypothetical protein EYO76_03925, partial [Flavobacteriaceae bacterium]|nr:hypothetical protein [Flavobacteriaceae bacterium]
MDASGVGQFAPQIRDISDNGVNYFRKNNEDQQFEFFTYSPFRPINAVSDNGPYHFEFHDEKRFLILKSLRLDIKCKVVKSTGANLDAGENVAIVNCFAHSLFDNINVKVNMVDVSDHSRNYQYKAYFMTNFSYGRSVKETNLKCDYFYQDDNADNSTVTGNETAFGLRKVLTAGSKTLYCTICPFIDLASGNNYLPPGVKLGLAFQRCRSSFSLLAATGDYSIKIQDLVMWARHVTPNS